MNNFVGAGGAAYMSKSNEWETPHELFNELDDEFCFTLDPCSTDLNAKCARHYTAEDDGLTKSWTSERVFCNPPYGRDIAKWVKKCHESVSDGISTSTSTTRPRLGSSEDASSSSGGGLPVNLLPSRR